MSSTLNKLTIIISIALTSIFAAPSSVQCMDITDQRTATQPPKISPYQQIADQFGNDKLPELTPDQIEEFYDQGCWSREQRELIKGNPSLKAKAAQLTFYEKNNVDPAFKKEGFKSGRVIVEADDLAVLWDDRPSSMNTYKIDMPPLELTLRRGMTMSATVYRHESLTVFWDDRPSSMSEHSIDIPVLDGGAITISTFQKLPEYLVILWATKTRLLNGIYKEINEIKKRG
jgi:hypothetical protein